jgi:adenylate cyclase
MALLAFTVGTLVDYQFGNQLDYWIHDPAVVFQARTKWQHTAIVVLDEAIPMEVTRLQSLPLFARATEKLIAAGAKGVFLDGNLAKVMDKSLSFAQCIEQNTNIRWLNAADENNAASSDRLDVKPLAMANNVYPLFRVAPYLPGQEDYPDFWLYAPNAQSSIPKTGLVALDRLVSKHSAIARWMDLSPQHAAIVLAKFINEKHVNKSLVHQSRDICDLNLPCRRVRLSHPTYNTQFSLTRPIIPVSKLASCDDKVAFETAALLKNRVVILQLTAPTEATDVHITPFTTALFGPRLLTPGAQYLADSVETLLSNDHPREPPLLLKELVLLMAACLGIYASVYLKYQRWLWFIGLSLFFLMGALCFFSPLMQLWPVTATLLTFIIAGLQGITLHLLMGFKNSKLMEQYTPKQVHSLLLSVKENESFHKQRYQAIVLISDIMGYTAVTEIMSKLNKEPIHIFELMNDYLNETSYILQKQYEGWLESYYGDMVCYYWPFKDTAETQAYQNALKGAVALSVLQKRFFSELPMRYKNIFDDDILQNICQIINAGIGLSSGSVVMGDLGPKQGVKKFSILGSPVNLTARIESLTRFFNTEIIITAAFLSAANSLHYPTRRLGCFCVKGRDQPEVLYAIGDSDDQRFQIDTIMAWEKWLSLEERELLNQQQCPDIFALDKKSLQTWKANNLLHNGIWIFDFK